jgi:endonuclease/exonuclease/phosphatase (EEP) superfamily protein YafD
MTPDPQPPRRWWSAAVRPRDAVLLVAPLLCLGCLACRWLPWDVPALIAAAALAPAAVLPAAAAALVAAVLRRPAVALAGIGCVLVAGAVLVPFRVPVANGSQPGTPLTVLTANLYFRNQQPEAAVDAVLSQDADLVLLQEVSPEVSALLTARAERAGYPWVVSVPRWGSTGLAMLSRHRVLRQETHSLGRQPLLHVDVGVAGRRVQLFNVHLEAPITRAAASRWGDQLDSLRKLATSLPSEPMIVAGDFNATSDHRQFRRLLTAGLTDLARRHAWPRLATWPVGKPLVPPLIQPDHVLASSDLVSTDLHAGKCPGSDHKLVVASLVLPGGANDR